MEIKLYDFSSDVHTIEPTINHIKNTFNSSWNDAVHDSFEAYVNSISTYANQIAVISEDFVAACLPLEKVDSQKIEKTLSDISEQYAQLFATDRTPS